MTANYIQELYFSIYSLRSQMQLVLNKNTTKKRIHHICPTFNKK